MPRVEISDHVQFPVEQLAASGFGGSDADLIMADCIFALTADANSRLVIWERGQLR